MKITMAAFGRKYLSNSDIGTLLTNPLAFGKPSKPISAFLVGGYFHTAILEPDKLKKYKDNTIIKLEIQRCTKKCQVENYVYYNTKLIGIELMSEK